MMAQAATSTPRRHLFVCGVGRSGTTALARCLNRHRRVVLGIERYRLALMDSSGAPAHRGLFDKDRFFDFRPGDAHVHGGKRGQFAPEAGWLKRLYDDAREKYDSALYVGDKVPGLYRRTSFLRTTFPSCKVVFLLRNPVAVGLSWQARADNPCDGWSRRNGFVAAIAQWNKAMEAAMLAKTVLGRDLIVVLFEQMFAADGLRRLFAKLDLAGDDMGDISDLAGVWQSAVAHDARACPAQSRYAEDHVDHGTYKWFKKEAQT